MQIQYKAYKVETSINYYIQLIIIDQKKLLQIYILILVIPKTKDINITIKQDNDQEMMRLIRENGEYNEYIIYSRTSYKYNSLKCLITLLEQFGDTYDDEGHTILQKAIQDQNEEAIRRILELPDKQMEQIMLPEKQTQDNVLSLAVLQNNVQIFTILWGKIKNFSSWESLVKKQNMAGQTCLMIAVLENRQWILQFEQLINVLVTAVDISGKTALMYAIKFNFEQFIYYMLPHEWNIPDVVGNYPIHFCIKQNQDILFNSQVLPYIVKTSYNTLKEDPLYFAIKLKKNKAIDIILKCSSNYTRNTFGISYLQLYMSQEQELSLNLIQKLINIEKDLPSYDYLAHSFRMNSHQIILTEFEQLVYNHKIDLRYKNALDIYFMFHNDLDMSIILTLYDYYNVFDIFSLLNKQIDHDKIKFILQKIMFQMNFCNKQYMFLEKLLTRNDIMILNLILEWVGDEQLIQFVRTYQSKQQFVINRDASTGMRIMDKYGLEQMPHFYPFDY